MATVAQLIKLLKKLPQDAEVYVLKVPTCHHVVHSSWISPELGKGIEPFDDRVYLGED